MIGVQEGGRTMGVYINPGNAAFAEISDSGNYSAGLRIYCADLLCFERNGSAPVG